MTTRNFQHTPLILGFMYDELKMKSNLMSGAGVKHFIRSSRHNSKSPTIKEEKTKESLLHLRRHVWSLQAELMHDPPRFDPIRSSVPVEHQRLPHPHDFACCRIVHRSILPCSFPVSRCRGTIGSEPGRVLAVAKAEEVPLAGIELGHICWATLQIIHKEMGALKMKP